MYKRQAYTRALLAATPRFDRPGHTLVPVDDALIAQLDDEALAYDRQQGLAAMSAAGPLPRANSAMRSMEDA